MKPITMNSDKISWSLVEFRGVSRQELLTSDALVSQLEGACEHGGDLQGNQMATDTSTAQCNSWRPALSAAGNVNAIAGCVLSVR